MSFCRSMGGAWPTFVMSLVLIGAMTTLVEQVRMKADSD